MRQRCHHRYCCDSTALQRDLAPNVGLVTETPALAGIDLLPWKSIVVGGHDIRQPSLLATGERLVAERVVPAELLAACRDDLTEIESRIRPGIAYQCGEAIQNLAEVPQARESSTTPRELIAQLQNDLQAFRTAEQVDQVVVVYLASTEPLAEGELPATWAEVAPLLDGGGESPLRASTL